MAQLDLLIRNGTVVTAGDIVRCDIGVTEGRDRIETRLPLGRSVQ